MKNNIIKGLSIAIAVLAVGSVGYWFTRLNHVSINEIGIAYDSSNGNITIQEKPGWYKTGFLTKVSYISTQPFKIDLFQGNSTVVINQKVIKFNPNGINEYIKLQGFEYMMGSSAKYHLKNYAFSGQKFSFLEILQESGAENNSQNSTNSVK